MSPILKSGLASGERYRTSPARLSIFPDSAAWPDLSKKLRSGGDDDKMDGRDGEGLTGS